MDDKSGQWERIYQRDGRVVFEARPQILKFTDTLLECGMRSVLDLGCGTGRHVVRMAQKGLHVTGLDNAPTALKLAREWLDEQELVAGLVLSDMRRPLPFRENSFDAVLSTQVIHHARLKSVMETAGEIDRVTRPDGMIMISVPALMAIQEDSRELIEIEPNTFVPMSGDEKGLPHHFFPPEDFRDLFPGFQVSSLKVFDERVMVLIAVKTNMSR